MTSGVLNDEIERLLVRFFRAGEAVRLQESQFRLTEDLEYLRVQWALSKQIEDLAQHLVENRHEAQSTLESVRHEGSSLIRGRILPVRTLILQKLTGDSTQVSYLEPRRTYTEGPNHVLAWVLRFSHHVLQRHMQIIRYSDQYEQRTHRIFRHIGTVRQLKGIGEAIEQTSLRQRPSLRSLQQAGRSRKRLYRKAFDAYQLLIQIEAGNSNAIIRLLDGSLLGPLEEWQKFELLVALRMSEALSGVVGEPLVLRPIQPGASQPIASIGRFDVYWQTATNLRSFPEPEPSERKVQEILNSYGLRVGTDRPDVVIVDRISNTVLALAEAKYSESGSSSWQDAFRDAAFQLVRYSRLYNQAPQDELLRRSLIAVSNIPNPMPAPSTAPVALGLSSLQDGHLEEWASRVTPFWRSVASSSD